MNASRKSLSTQWSFTPKKMRIGNFFPEDDDSWSGSFACWCGCDCSCSCWSRDAIARKAASHRESLISSNSCWTRYLDHWVSQGYGKPLTKSQFREKTVTYSAWTTPIRLPKNIRVVSTASSDEKLVRYRTIPREKLMGRLAIAFARRDKIPGR